MILPIVVYGDPVLKQPCDDIDADHPGLEDIIKNMWQTMYHAQGVGLAAPQVGLSIRLFVVDTLQLRDKGREIPGIKKVFINATILDESGEPWKYEEGCLSIPGIREDVFRQAVVRIHYFDEQFNEFEETYDGINARVIQHEYDHIEGILFTDKLKPLTKKLVQPKLLKIQRGDFEADYRTKVYKK